MGVPAIDTGPFTLDDFFAFTERRPDGERWELIEGMPVMNASGSFLHQIIIKNIVFALEAVQRQRRSPWAVIPGISTVVSPINAPVPDVLVRPSDNLRDWKCDDAIVAFEVLSPSTEKVDMRWKRIAYTSLPSLQHYVVVAQDTPEIVFFDRAAGFREQRTTGIQETLHFEALNLSLPLVEIYRDCGF